MKKISIITLLLFVQYAALYSITITIPTPDKIHTCYRTISQLKKFFKEQGLEYLEHMQFAHKHILYRNMKEDEYYKDHEKVAQKLTKKYTDAIKKNHRAPIELHWVNEKVGYGVFAYKKIYSGDFIEVYTGVVDFKDNIADKDYCWAYPVKSDDNRLLSCDAKFKGNEMRYVNHSYQANVIMKYILVDNVWYVCYIATKDILAGQQLLVDYGRAYWDTRSISCENL